MGRYDAAVDLARGTNAPPNAALVRRFASRPGLALNLEQDLGHSTGAFGRVSVNDGRMEAFEFTEINRSLAGGFSFTGAGWGRPHDGAGIAGVVNALSPPARRYFAAGGQGILIGDGQLPHYGTERIFEADYQFGLTEWLATAVDFQFIANPAYNRDRGPVSVIGLRLHIQF